MLTEIRSAVQEVKERVMGAGGLLDVANKEKEVEKLEKEMSDPNFWNNPIRAQEVSQQIARLKSDIDFFNKLKTHADDIETLLELAESEEDESLSDEIQGELSKLEKELDQLEFRLMLNGPHDRNNAILEIHSGAGGTESQDWADMLLRMYLRWCESKGFRTEIIDMLQGDEAGIKSVTVMVTGEYAYGYLRAEIGVHRLVRLSPFDANHRRHTSFASVSVIPEIEDNVDIQINESDLRIDTFRSGGPGGQHVNKTDSAVRITHIPTGIVAQCQSERSQHKNRETAMKVLRARLYELEMQKKSEEMAKIQGEKRDIAFGSQIRSYVFHPYRMIKDLRTGVEFGDVDRIMDGDLDPFITAYLKSNPIKQRESKANP
ncbi:TPA: peptide chain release factor 2 [Candidatus Poribacteria bacterium]|nr:peptide chain release factor 2 [Candidatus Poribacteria bacterium]